jgi:hypothetical protein
MCFLASVRSVKSSGEIIGFARPRLGFVDITCSLFG